METDIIEDAIASIIKYYKHILTSIKEKNRSFISFMKIAQFEMWMRLYILSRFEIGVQSSLFCVALFWMSYRTVL